jgi:NADH-quinone oxidoreductase subunit N
MQPNATPIPPLPAMDTGDLQLSTLTFLPELIVCAGIILMLLLRLMRGSERSHQGSTALIFLLLALLVSVLQFPAVLTLARRYSPTAADLIESVQGPLFGKTIWTNLLFFDDLTVYMRVFLYGFTTLVVWLSLTTGIPDREDSADFYILLMGATLGMVLMAESAHLLMLYIAIEMASLPSYALAGYLKGKRQSSEAALKYVVYGGGASGVMLFGISLLAGKFGTGYLPDLAVGFARTLAPPAAGGLAFDPVLLLGGLFLLVGIGFKLAAVPFHFWCPDVFEGASAEVAGFLSVASKAAALVMLTRVAYILGGVDTSLVGEPTVRWIGVVRVLVPALAVMAALTTTFGNLAAYVQTNLKRLLAYSTIAQAGYMLMAVATLSQAGLSAMLFYLFAYLFMNLGAFAVAAYLRNETGSEDLADYRGLVRRSPWMVVTLAFFLLSLLGVPPLIGFFAKFQVFKVLYQAGQDYTLLTTHPADPNVAPRVLLQEPVLGWTMYALLVIGAVNTVISAVYYMKVLKVMILDRRAEDLEGREPVRLRERPASVAFAVLLALAVLGLGPLWNPLVNASDAVSQRMQSYVNANPKWGNRPLPAVPGGAPQPPPPRGGGRGGGRGPRGPPRGGGGG